jgi:hypothetical protein
MRLGERRGDQGPQHLALPRVQSAVSVKLGTTFEDSPISFSKWLPAMWLLAANRNGISSYEVARGLGVTQKTAWFMMHRLRLAMKADGDEMLSGTVEADETFVGGKKRTT